MKSVADNFKFDIKEYGRQLDAKIIYDGNIIEKENINSLRPCLEGSLFKSAMHYFEIDSNIKIPENTIIDIKIGVM